MRRAFSQSFLLLISLAAVCQFGKRFQTIRHHFIYCRAEKIKKSNTFFISSFLNDPHLPERHFYLCFKSQFCLQKWRSALGDWHRLCYPFSVSPMTQCRCHLCSFSSDGWERLCSLRGTETCLYQRPGMRRAVKAQLHWQIQFSLAHKIFKSSSRSESQPCGKYQGRP